ncbi:MAG: hypothetical protein K0V04_07705 [Deltaproteobacteria bacterium]|nr:hypothetical protein [Deltaproteobacteria bacterium]
MNPPTPLARDLRRLRRMVDGLFDERRSETLERLRGRGRPKFRSTRLAVSAADLPHTQPLPTSLSGLSGLVDPRLAETLARVESYAHERLPRDHVAMLVRLRERGDARRLSTRLPEWQVVAAIGGGRSRPGR